MFESRPDFGHHWANLFKNSASLVVMRAFAVRQKWARRVY